MLLDWLKKDKFEVLNMKKAKIKLGDMERRILVKLLYEKRNELIRESRYTDAIDELILKIIDAKGR